VRGGEAVGFCASLLRGVEHRLLKTGGALAEHPPSRRPPPPRPRDPARRPPARLLHPSLVGPDGEPLAADKRRKWCDVPANVADLEFSPDLVYSFGWWQHFFDMGAYKVGAALGESEGRAGC
jgi:hypothetical protein